MDPVISPTLTHTLTLSEGATLPAATYYVAYRHVYEDGSVSLDSPIASITVVAAGILQVAIPRRPPGVNSIYILIGTDILNLRKQGSTTTTWYFQEVALIPVASIRQCANGHYLMKKDYDDSGECMDCYSTDLKDVTDPQELMKLAEEAVGEDRENMHRFADEALYQRLAQIDPTLAQRYQMIREEGFWYA